MNATAQERQNDFDLCHECKKPLRWVMKDERFRWAGWWAECCNLVYGLTVWSADKDEWEKGA